MGKADEEPSAGSQEFPVDIKKQLIATFGAVIYKDWMPSLPIKISDCEAMPGLPPHQN